MPKPASAFYALQVRSADASSVRYLYLRPHTDSSESVGAAVFVAGIGVTYDESVLTDLFAVFGKVSHVASHQNKVCPVRCVSADSLNVVTQPVPCLGIMQTSALVVFASASSVKKAIRTAAEGKALTVAFQEPAETFGLKSTASALSQTFSYSHLMIDA